MQNEVHKQVYDKVRGAITANWKSRRVAIKEPCPTNTNRAKWRQIDVAQAVGVSEITFNRWEKGVAIPTLDNYAKVEEFFSSKGV